MLLTFLHEAKLRAKPAQRGMQNQAKGRNPSTRTWTAPGKVLCGFQFPEPVNSVSGLGQLTGFLILTMKITSTNDTFACLSN